MADTWLSVIDDKNDIDSILSQHFGKVNNWQLALRKRESRV